MLTTISLFSALWAVCYGEIPSWSPTACGKSKYSDAGEMDLPTGFIVGGDQARSGEFPWQVSIRYRSLNYEHYCGGSIINENWVVTAAHCIRLGPVSSVLVVAGEWNDTAPNDYRQFLNVELIKKHEKYRFPRNDIALIKVATPITFNENVQPVCAPDSSVDYTYRKVLTSGWGDQISGGRLYPDTLRYVTLNVTTNAYCQNEYDRLDEGDVISADMLCASDNVGSSERDACQADSGGPLVFKEADGTFRLVGVVSGGEGCASGYPGYYARVTYFQAWILNFINSN